jgi:hypothetical protein
MSFRHAQWGAEKMGRFSGRSGEGWTDEDRFAVKLADLFHQSI